LWGIVLSVSCPVVIIAAHKHSSLLPGTKEIYMVSSCKIPVIITVWSVVLASIIFISYRTGASSCPAPALSQQPAVGVQTPKPKTTTTPETDEPELIFTNHNPAAVSNKPAVPTTFTIETPRTITSIETYHWNNARGSEKTGTISLTSADGSVYGPWNTTGTPGQGGVPNAYWTATPDMTLQPGTYTVVDSDPDTWAQNSGSGNSGMTKVYAR